MTQRKKVARKTRLGPMIEDKHHVYPDDPQKAALYELGKLDYHGGGIFSNEVQRWLDKLAKSRPWPEDRVEEALAHLLISFARTNIKIHPNSPLDRELGGLACAYTIGFLRFEDLIRPEQLEEAFMEEVHHRARLRDKRHRSKTEHTRLMRTDEQWLEKFLQPELSTRQLAELCWMQRREPPRWETEGLRRRGPEGGYLRQDYISFLSARLDDRWSKKIYDVLTAYYRLEWKIRQSQQQFANANRRSK